MRKFLTVGIFLIAIAWFGHTFSKNFIVDADFTKFLAHKGSTKLLQDTLWVVLLKIHIVLSLIAIIAGPFAFLRNISSGSTKFHRTVGKIYVLAVFLNFLPALYISFFATGGWITCVGFVFLNLVWFLTTYSAYCFVLKRNIKMHKEWMTRSYAVTLANTSIYLITMFLTNILQFEYVLAYKIAVWSSWVVNIGIAEVFIRKSFAKRDF